MAQETKIPIRVNKPPSPEAVKTVETALDVTAPEARLVQQKADALPVKQDLIKAEPIEEGVKTEKDPYLKALEDILSEGLGDYYLAMPQDAQNKFRTRGEFLALKIDGILNNGKFNPEKDAKKIFNPVCDWLEITGGSGAFIKQEAKLKTDSLMQHGARIS